MSELLEALRCDRGGCPCHVSARRGRGLTHCPAHDDFKPSLSVFSGRDGERAWDCKAGCDWLTVTRELEARGLVHSVQDRNGHLAAIHERKGRWVQADGRLGLGGTSPKDLLYGAELLRDAARRNVIVAEGEKCADALRALGFVAVATVCGGASVPSRRALRPLAGFTVYVWPDNDEAGRRHMHRIAAILRELGCQVFVIEWAEAPEHGDVADLVAELGIEHARAAVETLLAESIEFQVSRPKSDGERPRADRQLAYVNLAQVDRREVRWLWFGWIARGALAVLTGHPDMGKSWLTLYIAAAITRGWKLFGDDQEREPASVLLLTAEDPLEYVIGPRLDRLGADSKLVDAIQGTRLGDGPERLFNLVEDLDLLEQRLAAGRYALVIIDPLNAYMGIDLDTHRDAAVRSVLGPVAALAEKWDVAVVGIIHPTKGARELPLYRIQGSVANSAAARTAIIVGRDEQNDGEASPKRHVALLKNNLIADADKPKALTFELTRERGFEWIGVSDVTPFGLLSGPDPTQEEARSEQDEACQFLLDALAQVDGEELTAADAINSARKEGISERTLQRARKHLGWGIRREGFGRGSRVIWGPRLPHSRHIGDIDDKDSALGAYGAYGESVAPMDDAARQNGGPVQADWTAPDDEAIKALNALVAADEAPPDDLIEDDALPGWPPGPPGSGKVVGT